MSRIDTIRQRAADHGASAALICHPADLRWAVGFTGSNGLLVVTPEHAHFVTDGRYTAQAAAEVSEAAVHIAPRSLADYVEEHLSEGLDRAVVQSDRITVSELGRYREAIPTCEFVPVAELLAASVASKTEAEIDAVRRAQALTCEVFESLLSLLAPGMTEQELAAEIVYQHLRRGASGMSFEPIVAAGARGALPHARPTSATIRRGDLVVIDMGCVLDGYCSDLTRTVAIGAPSDDARRAYDVVRDAQHQAIAKARAGMTGRQLDAVARDVIEAAGLGEAFSHSLGHGVGLDIHEWPRVSKTNDAPLPLGTTLTIEPGVYLEGAFGIRIEDVIVLREEGCDNLTPLPTDLLVL